MDIHGALSGLGVHYWNVNFEQYTPLYKVCKKLYAQFMTNGTQLFYASQFLYIGVQVFAKVSILILYLRLFTRRWFTLTCKLGIIFIVLHGISFIFAVAFQCTPVHAIWDPYLQHSKKCLNLPAIGISGAIFSIVEDVVILLLPVPEILRLHMSTNKKWGLLVMFAIGSL